MTAALLLVAVLVWGLGGLALLAVLARPAAARLRGRWLETAGLTLMLGIGLTTWVQFVWSLLGGAIGRTFLLSWGGICLVIVWRLGGRIWKSMAAADVRSNLAVRWMRWAVGAIWINLALQAVLTPQRLWDERAIFGIKGAILWEDAVVASPALLHPDFVQGHPRYPLLLPLTEASIYSWLGRVDDRWAKLVPPLLALGLWLTFAGVLSRRLGPGPAWLWTLLLAATPALTTWDYGFLTAQADASVGCFHGLSVLYLWDWLCGDAERERDPDSGIWPPAVVAGIAAALTLWTKDEGIALALVDGIILCALAAIAALRPDTFGAPSSLVPRARAAACGGGALVMIAAPWFLYRRWLPATDEMGYFERLGWEGLLAGAAAIPWIVTHLAGRMFREAATWGVHWWAAAAGCGLRLRRAASPPQALLWLDILGGLSALIVAGILAPIPPVDHIGGSAHRFLLQLTPVAVLLAATQFHPRLTSRSPNEAEAAT